MSALGARWQLAEPKDCRLSLLNSGCFCNQHMVVFGASALGLDAVSSSSRVGRGGFHRPRRKLHGIVLAQSLRAGCSPRDADLGGVEVLLHELHVETGGDATS